VVFITGNLGNQEDSILAFFNSLPQIAFLLTENGEIKEFNEKSKEWLEQISLAKKENNKIKYYPELLKNAGCNPEKVISIKKNIKSLFADKKKEFKEEISLEYNKGESWFKIQARIFEEHVTILMENITKRKKYKINTLFKNNTSAIAILDCQGKIKGINDEFQNVFGYKLAEIKGKLLDDVMERGKIGAANRKVTAELLAGNKRKGKGTRYDKWGTPKEFLFHGIPIIVEGEVEGAYALYDEITELTREKEKLEAIFNASQDVAFVLTGAAEDSKVDLIKEFSPGAENLFGYDREEVINKSVSILHTREDVEKLPEIYRHLAQGKRWEDKIEAIRKNGEKFPALFTAYPVRSKFGASRDLGVFIDITELEETRKKLEQTKNQLEAILESIQDGISVLDPDLTVRYTNNTMEEWYEKNAPLKGKKCYQVFHNKSKPCSDCPTLRCMESGEVEKEIVPGLESSDIEHLEIYTHPMINEKTEEVTGVVEFVRDISERLKAERKLKRKKLWSDALFEEIPTSIVKMDNQGNIVEVNKKFAETFGYHNDEVQGENLDEVLERGRSGSTNKDLTYKITEGKNVMAEGTRYDKQGKPREFIIKGIPITINEEVVGAYGIYEDITHLKEIEDKLRIREEQYRKIFETAPVGIMLEDSRGNILNVNDSLCQMSGYSKDELIGKSVIETLTPVEYRDEAKKNIAKIIAGQNLDFTGVSRKKTGEKYYVQFSETKVSLPQEGTGILSIQMDITELKKKEDNLRYLSYHDGLTGLYNRSYLEAERERLDTKRQLPISLIMCDVNGMKIVNDTYGHKMGDELLIKVADILRECTRDEDIVARWAGDEFVILLPQTDSDKARKIASRIERNCEQVKLKDIPITMGIGIAVKKTAKEKFSKVLARADEKMYKDKLTKANSAENKLVQNMLNTLAAKSAETKEHALRMVDLAHRIGEKLNLSSEQLNKLSLLATLHDIGKTTISEEILTKPKDLSEKEWEIIKEHPQRGYTIASATEEFAPIAKAILHHHEHWDGTGYPGGLAGKEIPLLSRIISLVDSYDVMTTGRPYKKAMSKEEALAEIKMCASSQFDPELAEKFVEMMAEED